MEILARSTRRLNMEDPGGAGAEFSVPGEFKENQLDKVKEAFKLVRFMESQISAQKSSFDSK